MSVTTDDIHQAIRRTRAARDRSRQRSRESIVAALAQTATNWLAPDSPWRVRAIEQAPAPTGFSSAMVNEAVDLTFSEINDKALRTLLLPFSSPLPAEGEAGLAPASTGEGEIHGSGSLLNQHPSLIAHFLAGNVPSPGIASICCGLLSKSANLVKVSNRDPVFPTLFVESLHEVDAELADCVAVLNWRREEPTITKVALADADAVIAYGDDETVAAIRQRCRPDVRFLGFGHKLSFAVIAKEALTTKHLVSLAGAAAFDGSVYDQQGCLSPHAFYVQSGGQVSPRAFAAALADAMAAYEARIPRGPLTIQEAAEIAKLRGAYEFRSASDKRVAVWSGADTTQAGTPVPPRTSTWLVIYEEDPMFTPSCLNRVVFVKPIKELETLPQLMRRFASNLSTVGVAPMDQSTAILAEDMMRLGAHRVCPVGQMQRPPLSLSP
jgi:hypothetical protein